ncbi:MAG: hypothetical protein ACFWTZ_00130 [Burkholderia sp.]|jgi:membrane-associated HD superfamily phosphohydrolase
MTDSQTEKKPTPEEWGKMFGEAIDRGRKRAAAERAADTRTIEERVKAMQEENRKQYEKSKKIGQGEQYLLQRFAKMAEEARAKKAAKKR